MEDSKHLETEACATGGGGADAEAQAEAEQPSGSAAAAAALPAEGKGGKGKGKGAAPGPPPAQTAKAKAKAKAAAWEAAAAKLTQGEQIRCRGELRSTGLQEHWEKRDSQQQQRNAVEDQAPLTITFSFVSGEREIELVAYGNQRVHNLKSTLAWQLGITSARLKLVFGTEVLASSTTLSVCGLEDKSQVTAIILPPLYEGTEVYEKVAEHMAAAHHEKPSEEEVRNVMEGAMERKVALHDAMQAAGKLRKKM